MTETIQGPDSPLDVATSDQPEMAGPTATPVLEGTPVPQETAAAFPAAEPGERLAQEMDPFDYFVLALSWSPDYCATSGGDDPQQCSLGRKLGFVVHGLWPQNESSYPADCSTEKLPAEVQAQFPGLYPSHALYTHEWEKHGTCTGLTPQQYLALTKQIRDRVVIPERYRAPAQPFRTDAHELKQAFEEANPTIRSDGLEVSCSGSGRYLKELYVCFSRAGSPTACGNNLHKSALKSCARSDFLVRNTR
jgi:ribonuclease T2